MARRRNRKRVVVNINAGKGKSSNKQKKSSEVTELGKIIRSLGGLAGAAAGNYFGGNGPVGAMVGSSLGGSLSRWLGAGDYRVSSNSIVRGFQASGSIPMMHKNDQTIVVRHREFVCEIQSSIAFSVLYSFELNPGLGGTFPWLAAVAENFQEYRFKGAVFHYVPTSGSASGGTNSALGSVMLQTSYRSTDDPPSNKREMLNEYCASEAVPCEAFVHPIECSPKENPFNIQYVRTSQLPADENKLMYDLGVTHVAVSGQQQAGITLGDLWVTYEVELKKPLVASDVTSGPTVLGKYTFFPTVVASPFTNLQANTTGVEGITFNDRTISFSQRTTGQYYFYFQVKSNPPYFSGAANWAGTPSTINCSTLLLDNSAQNDWETVMSDATNDAVVRNFTYAVGVDRRNQSAAGSITLPIPTVAGGAATLGFVFVTVHGLRA